MFWDGSRWLKPAKPQAPTHEPRRLRDWLAAGIMIFAAVAIVIPVLSVKADGPSLRLLPDRGPVGTAIVIELNQAAGAFPAAVAWDGVVVATVKPHRSAGAVTRLTYTVPTTASVGPHEVSLFDISTPGTKPGSWRKGSRPKAQSLAVATFLLTVAASSSLPSATLQPATSMPATPDPATPGAATSMPATPDPATPGAASPGPATPDPATPGAATPGAATPDPATPGAATPVPGTPVPAPNPGNVPASIDATGSRDVTAALQSFLNSVPNGSTVQFRGGGQYRVDGTLVLQNRRNLVLDGNGARIFAGTTGGSGRRQWTVRESVDITFRDMIVQGVGNAVYTPSYEGQHAFGLDGGRDIELDRVTIRNPWGDGVYVSSSNYTWIDGVWIHDSSISGVGRQGIAVVAGRNVRVERTSFSNMGATVLDIEPNRDPNYMQGADNIVFVNNTVTGRLVSYFFAAGGWGTISNVVVSGNVIRGADGASGRVRFRRAGPLVDRTSRSQTIVEMSRSGGRIRRRSASRASMGSRSRATSSP